MCQFFSCISNGKGKVEFFKPEDIVRIMIEGNPEAYDFNSHTSLCHFKGIKGEKEDKWNKWEYSPEKDEIKEDSLVTTDDREKIVKALKGFFKGKDFIYLRNLYGRSTGDSNTAPSNHLDTTNAPVDFSVRPPTLRGFSISLVPKKRLRRLVRRLGGLLIFLSTSNSPNGYMNSR